MQASSTALAQTYSGKSDEELCSLHARGTLTAIAYEVLESELRRRGVAIPERPTPEKQTLEATRQHERTTLLGHWKGKASLASAYWLVGKLGFAIFYGLALLIKQ